MASGTPSAQVRIPVRDLILPPPPPTSAHTILLGEKIYPMVEKLCGGRINIRRQNKYPQNYPAAGAGGPKSRKRLTVPKSVAQCRKYPIPDLNTLRDRSISLYITKDLRYHLKLN